MTDIMKELREYWLLCKLFRSDDPNGRDLAIRGMRTKSHTAPLILRVRYAKVLAPLDLKETGS